MHKGLHNRLLYHPAWEDDLAYSANAKVQQAQHIFKESCVPDKRASDLPKHLNKLRQGYSHSIWLLYDRPRGFPASDTMSEWMKFET